MFSRNAILKRLSDWFHTPPHTPSLPARCMAEAFGCMVFHFIGSVSSTAVVNGICLMVLVYYTAKVSGGHLNPAVSLTFLILGHANPVEFVMYITCQIIGCIMGALWIAALVPHVYVGSAPPSNFAAGCFLPDYQLSEAEVFGWEAVGTFCFIVPIFSVVWYTQHKSGYGNTGPLIVGLSLLSTAIAVGPWTGAALNPARAIGSPVVFDCPSEHFTGFYIIGEFVGAMCAACAIVPWYGISSNPWYYSVLPQSIKTNLTNSPPGGSTPSREGHSPHYANATQQHDLRDVCDVCDVRDVRDVRENAVVQSSATRLQQLLQHASSNITTTHPVVITPPENAYVCALPFNTGGVINIGGRRRSLDIMPHANITTIASLDIDAIESASVSNATTSAGRLPIVGPENTYMCALPFTARRSLDTPRGAHYTHRAANNDNDHAHTPVPHSHDPAAHAPAPAHAPAHAPAAHAHAPAHAPAAHDTYC